ncbi:MAG TPA: DUF1345 domain-containing protein [Streptosporangiaceae bacterium]|nr:DUF1345 domain-containing protein [Streptosporangiaceae bacterium]
MTDPAQPPGPPPRLPEWLWRRRRTRLAVSAAFGIVAAVLVSAFGNWIYAPALGWDVTALMFAGSVWFGIWPLAPDETAKRATREDPSRATSDLLTLCACVASIAAVMVVLVHAHSVQGADKGLLATLGLLSIAVSWVTVHTIFTLRYALLYYAGPVGVVDFHSDERPSYRDFAYLAFTIGMTFQVSDTDLKSTAMRATALRHALLSYLFGSLILAAAVNLVAGLS